MPETIRKFEWSADGSMLRITCGGNIKLVRRDNIAVVSFMDGSDERCGRHHPTENLNQIYVELFTGSPLKFGGREADDLFQLLNGVKP
jgi:hypothetical protein